jgi:hypothetical protein
MRNSDFLIFMLIITLFPSSTFSQFDGFPGDLRVTCNATSGTFTVKMEIASVPFEGIVENKKEIHYYNRIGEIYNGTVHRLYYNSGSGQYNYPIFYKNVVTSLPNGGNILSLGHCSGGELPDGAITDGAWGFAEYKFTITRTVGSTNEEYVFYLNCLDSKYGKNNFEGRYIYANDWTIKYLDSRPENNKVILTGFNNLHQEITYAEFNTTTEPELKVWELLYNNPVPYEKNFQARTTPFPIHPQLLEINYNTFKELVLGTTVTFGNVYNNVGGHDIYGYNTVTNYLYNYYDEPPIPIQLPPSEKANTFCTPGYYDLPNSNYGMTIKVLNDDKIIINENKKLWVTGYWPVQQGDLLKFESGSVLEKQASAQINTCYYGRLVDYGANTVWGNYSRHTAFANSTLEYYGMNIS